MYNLNPEPTEIIPIFESEGFSLEKNELSTGLDENKTLYRHIIFESDEQSLQFFNRGHMELSGTSSSLGRDLPKYMEQVVKYAKMIEGFHYRRSIEVGARGYKVCPIIESNPVKKELFVAAQNLIVGPIEEKVYHQSSDEIRVEYFPAPSFSFDEPKFWGQTQLATLPMIKMSPKR